MMDILKALDEHAPREILGLNSYVLIDEEGSLVGRHHNKPCFSELQDKFENNLRASRYIISYSGEVYKDSLVFAKWMLEESPFKDVFVEGLTPEIVINEGVVIDTSAPSGICATALIFHRALWEYSERVGLFNTLVESGLDKTLCSILMWMLYPDRDDEFELYLFSDGHTPLTLTKISKASLVNYYNSVNPTEATPFNVEGKYVASYNAWAEEGENLAERFDFNILSKLLPRKEVTRNSFGVLRSPSFPIEEFKPVFCKLKEVLSNE